jgi:hypothetical protein
MAEAKNIRKYFVTSTGKWSICSSVVCMRAFVSYVQDEEGAAVGETVDVSLLPLINGSNLTFM